MIPIIYPVIVKLGFDPVWFGAIVVMVVELGMIMPPIGINVFVAFPILSTFLPSLM